MNTELARISILIRNSPGAALSVTMCTYLMDVTHIALPSPICESRRRNSVSALWLHPLCNAKCYSTLHPAVYVISDGQGLQRQTQTGAMRRVFSQLAGVGQGAHVLSTEAASKLCGRPRMHRARNPSRGGSVRGRGG